MLDTPLGLSPVGRLVISSIDLTFGMPAVGVL